MRGFQEASSEFQNEFKREAEQIEQAMKTSAQIEPKQLEGTKSKPEGEGAAQEMI